MAADGAALHRLQLGLELLDLCVGLLEILVEAVALGDELLLPLAETLLLDLDLLGEALAERLLLLLELGVVELSGTGLAELAGLHLLGTVSLVVQFLGCVDEVEHVGADQDGAQLLEIAVVLVLNLGNTPRVLSSLDNPAISALNILLGTDNSEWHSSHETAGMLGSSLVILLDRWLVDLDVLSLDDRDDLCPLLAGVHGKVTCINPTHSLLELSKVSRAQGIGLGDDGDQVHTGTESLHDLDVERLQSVAGRADEVQASMDTEVNLVLTTRLLLLKHV